MGHVSYSELAKIVAQAKKQVEVGSLYVHYRDAAKKYRVLFVGLLEESEQPCVAYRGEEAEDLIWVRGLDDWLSTVTLESGEKVPRFTKIPND